MKDGLQWYCESCHQLLHEEYFDLEDIVDQLAKAMTAFYEDKQNVPVNIAEPSWSRLYP